MTLSLTCSCGARLDIDDKFARQVIHCPDCNRSLNTSPPVPEPPHTSGYALASFLLATTGAFTLLGTAAAIACGVLGLHHIRRAPVRVGGKRFAQAGIILGSVFTLVTLIALATTEFLRLDGLVRVIEWAGKVKYTPDEVIFIDRNHGFDLGGAASIHRPSPSWGQLTFRQFDKQNTDDLVLVNLWEDAYIICLNKWLEGGQTLEDCRQEGQQRFLQSDLVTRILGRMRADSPPLAGQERESKQLPGTDTQELVLDLRLGGISRTFLVRILRHGNWLHIVAGGTRRNRFARLEPDIVKALNSYQPEK